MDLTEIRRLGERRYFEDNGEYRNPYVLGTPEYNEFERGWTQSLKRDEGRLVSNHRGGAPDSWRASDRSARPLSDSEVLEARYREIKG